MRPIKHINKLVILFMTMTQHGTVLYSQPQHPLIEYTTEKGLSLNSVSDILFDKQGFLWLATDGLQRFDGYRFQTFKNDPADNKSIPDNYVSGLYEDAQENLWISHRKGLAFKPKRKLEFTDIIPPPELAAFKAANRCVGETDSTVLVINYNEGFYSVNKTTLQVRRISTISEYFGKEGFFELTRPHFGNKNIWLRRRSGKAGDIFLVTPAGLKRFTNDRHISLYFIIPDIKDSLVIVTDKQVFKSVAGDPFTAIRVLQEPFDAADLDNEYATWAREISNNRYLMIGTKKILEYDRKKEKVDFFPFQDYFSADLLRYLNITTKDRHGNSWLAYNGIGGIKVLSPKKFGQFEHREDHTLPYCISTDERGNVYVGIYLGDIEVYDKDGHFLKKLILPEEDKKFGSPRAMAMIDSSTLIVRSVLNKLYAIDIHTGKRQDLTHFFPLGMDKLMGDFESGMQKKQDNEMLLSYRNIVFSLKKNKDGFTCSKFCTVPPDNKLLERINSFFYTKTGQLWIATLNEVWLFENNQMQKMPLPLSYFKHINQHPDGKVWATTTDGIYVLKDKQLFKRIGTKEGLPNSFVYGVLFDDEGNSWVSTNRGLAKIDPSFHITTYSAKEGLQGDEFNTKGYCKGPDGTLYFAGVSGVNFFKPQNLVSKGEASETMLTGIEVNNQPYEPYLQPEYIQTINLPYNQNNIRLSFSYMDLTVPERNQYKFWLKGSQGDWSLPQTNNTVQYILPPGEYQLYVLGANYEGVWSKDPLVLHINILPPWYQTTWAYIIFMLMALVVVGAIFYFIWRSRYQKQLRQLQMEQEVHKEKQRLSRDLHDNLGSQITWLSNNISQLERAQLEDQPVEKKLSQLKEGTGELMQTLRETIWILNKDKIKAVDLFDKLVSLAARHIEVCPPMQLHTEEDLSPGIELNSGQALQVFRICQEAINNACKHAQASELRIKAVSTGDRFIISISDNGKGFVYENAGTEGHYGLQNMKERAQESNLDLKIDSSPGTGTTISITTL